MKKAIIKKLSAGIASTAIAVMSIPAIPALPASAASVGDKLSVGSGQNQHKGNCDGYSYEVWLDNTGGNGSMTLGKGATFKAEWSASVSRGNFLARRGLDFGSTKKATSYEYIGMDYKANYQQTGSASGNSRLCVYGWFQNQGAAGNVPLVEYYIIEDWVDWCPDGNGKMVTIDGAQYKIFQNDHTGPSINSGSETFKQYFSVRQQKRTSGHITVSDHFKAWEQQGWGIGNLYEVALNAEGWQSSGVADITELDVYTQGTPSPTDPTDPTDPPEPDKDGYWFHDTFESSTDDWSGRGAASVSTSKSTAFAGSKALEVTGRTNEWNGAIKSLGSEFEAGKSYSFSVNAAYDKGDATRDFKLTLQYTSGGDTKWDEIATGTTYAGKWVQLSNTNYKLPSGSDYSIIVETTDGTLEDFYIDEAIGAPAGTKIEGAGTPDLSDVPQPTTQQKPGQFIAGDVTCDGRVDTFDLVALRQGILSESFKSDNARYAADVDADDSVGTADLVLLSNYLLGKGVELKKPEMPVSKMRTISEYTPIIEKMMVETEPSASHQNKGGVGYGKIEKKSYYSNFCKRNKKYNVLLPDGYSTSKQYPVLYVLHGYYENPDRMITTGNGQMYTQQILGNLIAEGAAKEMILVFPHVYSSATQDDVSGMDDANNRAYDNFETVLINELMPEIEKNYSVATGRENTAITGFSMGGRESLQIGMNHPDLFGYMGAICPAPGTSGSWKFPSEEESPSIIMITGGGQDDVVYNNPETYKNNFQKNNVPVVWHYVNNGHHGDDSIHAHYYNFFRAVFNA